MLESNQGTIRQLTHNISHACHMDIFDVPYLGMYVVPGHEGMYPPPEDMLTIPWAPALGPGYGGMYTCNNIKH